MITIYALMRKNKVVYVGQSKNVKNRVYQHSLEKEFDNYVELDKAETKEEACVLEDHYIIKYDPSYNKTLNNVSVLRSLREHEEEKEEMSLLDMSVMFCVNKYTIIDWTKREGLPYYETDETIEFKKSDVLEWIESKKQNN